MYGLNDCYIIYIFRFYLRFPQHYFLTIIYSMVICHPRSLFCTLSLLLPLLSTGSIILHFTTIQLHHWCQFLRWLEAVFLVALALLIAVALFPPYFWRYRSSADTRWDQLVDGIGISITIVDAISYIFQTDQSDAWSIDTSAMSSWRKQPLSQFPGNVPTTRFLIETAGLEVAMHPLSAWYLFGSLPWKRRDNKCWLYLLFYERVHWRAIMSRFRTRVLHPHKMTGKE